MEQSIQFRFFMSQITPMQDIKETDKIKISIVFYALKQSTCILRVCKGRDLSAVCEALVKTKNPNTVVVYDYIYESGDTYILEENIVGESLENIMKKNGTFDERETAKIIIQVCKALAPLHTETPPIVHNDINPSNIMMRDDCSIKLFDFDISRTYKKGHSKNTTLFGTEEYASPEHFGYGQSEPRTDIYCLGVTMHKMLTNLPLSSEHRITYKGKLKNILLRCLEFDPKNRYATVISLQKDLEKFLSKKTRLFRHILSLLSVFVLIFAILQTYIFFTNNESSTDADIVPQDTNISTIEDSNINEENSNPEASLVQQDDSSNNHSKEKAQAISFDERIRGQIEDKETPDWYKFKTSVDSSIYRISLFPINAPTNMTFPHLYVSIYDSVGIKLEEFKVWSGEEYNFIDFQFKADTEYFIKISLGDRFETGSYEISLTKSACNVGTDKENATKLKLGEQHSATMDTTLSNWYVFQVPKSGDYTYTIYNIDVGCDIYFSKTSPQNAGEGTTIKNEDAFSGSISLAKQDDLIYFEIYPYNKNPEANGTYIIIIEEKNN